MWFFNSAYPIEEYPAKTRQAAAIMLMIMNNLDARVAQVYKCSVTSVYFNFQLSCVHVPLFVKRDP